MTQRALQTRMVGYTTDRTGHVAAPMEVVYEVDAPVRRPNWLQKGVVLVSLVGLCAGVLNALVYVASGGVDRLF